MWQVDNRTPFAAERGWVRDRNGAEVWLVAVKCTFDIQPDGIDRVSEEQPPVLRVPEYHGEPGKSSIKYEADLVLTKTTTDVIVVGHALRAGRPAGDAAGRRVPGRAGAEGAAGVRRSRRGARRRRPSPSPFMRMPLVYERAFGGVDTKSAHPERDWDWRNPVGTGLRRVARER